MHFKPIIKVYKADCAEGASLMVEQFYKISEFAKLIGVSSVTLRTWDEKGLLRPHHVSPSGYRYYSSAQLQDYLSGRLSLRKEVSVDDRS